MYLDYMISWSTETSFGFVQLADEEEIHVTVEDNTNEFTIYNYLEDE